jgi:hypothetical protein
VRGRPDLVPSSHQLDRDVGYRSPRRSSRRVLVSAQTRYAPSSTDLRARESSHLGLDRGSRTMSTPWNRR